ncbi:hypothetical protein KKG31_07575 [Patescibacteria group bacterium]|nr:hypothetical protein [Patescibacteria group bacterium]
MAPINILLGDVPKEPMPRASSLMLALPSNIIPVTPPAVQSSVNTIFWIYCTALVIAGSILKALAANTAIDAHKKNKVNPLRKPSLGDVLSKLLFVKVMILS